jgi:hypothetical protein
VIPDQGREARKIGDAHLPRRGHGIQRTIEAVKIVITHPGVLLCMSVT